jgi:hypothetical protein
MEAADGIGDDLRLESASEGAPGRTQCEPRGQDFWRRNRLAFRKNGGRVRGADDCV